MKRKTASKIIMLLLIAALFVCAAVFACGFFNARSYADADSDSDTGFTYQAVDVAAEVSEEKVLTVSERLKIRFRKEGMESFRRGVMRTFARSNSLFPLKSFNADLREASATVDGKSVNVENTISPNGAYFFVYIYADGTFPTDDNAEVVFNYVYDMSADVTEGCGKILFPMFNDAYYWCAKGMRYNLDLTFPEGFTVDKITTSRIDGEGGWTPAEGDIIAADGNKLSVSIAMTERVMLAAELPDGLFVIPYHSEYWVFFGLVIALIAAGCAVTYFYRGRTPVHTVEFTPPDVNPLFFSAYWHGYTRKRDVATLILQWAHLGCVKLKRDGRRDIIIKKVKPLPQTRLKEERRYFDALFFKNKVYSSREVRKSGRFWHRRRINNAVYELMSRADGAVTYEAAAEKARGVVPVLGFLAIALFAMYFTLVSGELGLVILVGMLAFLGIFEVYSLFLFKSILRKVRSVLVLRIIITLFLVSFTGPIIAVLAFAAGFYRFVFDYAMLMIIVAAWAVISFAVLPKFITKRTKDAQRLYARMLGFKRFIATAEVPRLERMMEDSPEYYYDILPYVMMMGLSRKADKKFAAVRGAAPEWADGFDLRHMASSLFSSVSGAVRGVAVRHKDVNDGEDENKCF